MATNFITMMNPGVQYCEFTISPVFPTCPVTGEPFAVAVTVQYQPAPGGLVVEYIDFEGWVRKQVHDVTLTLEEVAVVTQKQVLDLVGSDVPTRVIVEVLESCHCKAKAVVASGLWRDYL